MADNRASHSEKHKDDGVTTELIIQAGTENAKILNDALQEIGMGKYQIVTVLILTSVTNEFAFQGPFLKLGQHIGLLVGLRLLGRWVRRLGTQTLSRYVPSWLCGVLAWAAIFPWILLSSWASSPALPIWTRLTGLFSRIHPRITSISVDRPVHLVAWPLLANFSCPTTVPPSPCPRSENQGWRYFLYAMGGLMLVLFVLRFFVFHLHESPKYLMGRGRDEEAVEVVHKVARYNGKSSSLTLDMLRDAEGQFSPSSGNGDPEKTKLPIMDASALGAARRTLKSFGWDHVTPLFRTRKLAWSTSLLIIVWAWQLGGRTLETARQYITYRNQVILSVVGVPGALLAGWTVELTFLGRRGSLAISTVLTGVFLLASTTARSSAALLGWNCGYTFTSNIMYGVLYALSPELFPTKDRGTGNALVAAANRVFGVMAPIIALYADLTTSVPIYISGVLFIVAGFIAVLLPFEPRGKASL
ncbi:MFS general substrate transporter [Lactarius akahatsu]|uniref:MFS general substrate transporter n=1 Tax=Lactarius akahatsu TaxID=416441 RepID=A0AAD4L8I2_9AGAM|nr:MFS general substrate transporter [Lactarius akahatsu]